MTTAPDLRILALSGSPAHPSSSTAIAKAALDHAAGGDLVELAGLDPAALLALRSDAAVDALRAQVAAAHLLIVVTPVYRATYTALTKTIFDLLPQDALAGTVVVPIAVGYGPQHALAVDHGLRPLIASLAGLTVRTGVYATKADLTDGGAPGAELLDRIHAAVDEGLALVHR